MERYLIALDMDGTLLNKEKKITLKTRDYLKELTKEGHIIVLASGRPSRTLLPYYNELNLSSPLICYNGAYVYDPNDANFPSHLYSFPKEKVIEILNTLKPYIDNVMCETENDVYIDKEDAYLNTFFFYKGMKMNVGELKDILNDDPMTCIAKLKENITKDDKKNILNNFKEDDDLSLRYWTGSPYFELFYKSATKGACVKRIAKYYNIPKEHIIVFGDAENDLEMLKQAGYGVAMLNGKESFRLKADIVTKYTNEEDGIYYTLKDILEGKYLNN